jgi:putative transposase
MEQPTVCKTYKYKSKPTPTQEGELGRVLGLCRWLYNTAWQRARVSVSRYQQEAELKDTRAAFPEYAGSHRHVLQDVLARLDKTYQAFFRRLKAGKKAGVPRYQARTRWRSFRYKQFGNGITLDNGLLVLSKIGRRAIRWSRPVEGTPKTVTISKEAGGWYACFSCADVPVQPFPATGRQTGIDLGREAFATLSDGARNFSPGWYRKAERSLKTAQRRVSRRKKGSNRRRKAVALLAKAYQKVKRQRKDFHHKTALALVQTNDTISHEDLQTANMRKNRHLAKSIADSGWSQFLSILSFKAACAGRSVLGAPSAYTSQRCSGCGVVVAKGLSVR